MCTERERGWGGREKERGDRESCKKKPPPPTTDGFCLFAVRGKAVELLRFVGKEDKIIFCYF